MRTVSIGLALLVICTALDLSAPPVSAQQLHEVAPNGNHTNAVQTGTPLLIFQGVSMVCYVNADLEVVIAGSVNLTSWTSQVVGTAVNDAHYGCAVGIDRYRYIWVIFSLRDSPSFVGHVKRSANPWDFSTPFVSRDINLSPSPFSLTYPMLYQAKNELYLMFRNGSSGAGDTWLARLTAPDTWSIIGGGPIIAGRPGWITPIDSQYLGSLWAEANGDLHLVWTHRVGAYNYGVGYAKFEASTGVFRRSDGTPYALPITRNTAENILNDGWGDSSLSNTGLSVAKTNSVLHVGFNRLAASGSREVWYAGKVIGTSLWSITQISNAGEPRLRITPCSPTDPVPSAPCDEEVQGPQLVVGADLTANTVMLLWSIASARELPAWGRPPSKLYATRGRGLTSTAIPMSWTTHRVSFPVDRLSGQMPRDSSGATRVLYQELDGKVRGKPILVFEVAGLFSISPIDGTDWTCAAN